MPDNNESFWDQVEGYSFEQLIYEMKAGFEIEDLYQEFKKRLIEEFHQPVKIDGKLYRFVPDPAGEDNGGDVIRGGE